MINFDLDNTSYGEGYDSNGYDFIEKVVEGRENYMDDLPPVKRWVHGKSFRREKSTPSFRVCSI